MAHSLPTVEFEMSHLFLHLLRDIELTTAMGWSDMVEALKFVKGVLESYLTHYNTYLASELHLQDKTIGGPN